MTSSDPFLILIRGTDLLPSPLHPKYRLAWIGFAFPWNFQGGTSVRLPGLSRRERNGGLEVCPPNAKMADSKEDWTGRGFPGFTQSPSGVYVFMSVRSNQSPLHHSLNPIAIL